MRELVGLNLNMKFSVFLKTNTITNWIEDIITSQTAISLPPQRSWGKVMFLHVSVILFTGGCLPQCMLGYSPRGDPSGGDPHEDPPRKTPGGPPQEDRTPPRKTEPPLEDTRKTPQEDTPLEQCMLGDTGNMRAVRILLECILVMSKFWYMRMKLSRVCV